MVNAPKKPASAFGRGAEEVAGEALSSERLRAEALRCSMWNGVPGRSFRAAEGLRPEQLNAENDGYYAAMKSYVALVHARERGVMITFPDLRGCVSEGT